MNKWIRLPLSCLCMVASARAESLLRPASFPKTFEDVSFSDRMRLKDEDYELYRPEYDDEGFCIKNCAYPGLNIKYELEKSEQDTQQAVEQSQHYEQATQNALNNQPPSLVQQYTPPAQQYTLPVQSAPTTTPTKPTKPTTAPTQNQSSGSQKPSASTQNLPVNTQTIVSTISSTKTSGAKQCKDRNADIPVGQKVPWGEPLKGKPRITSPYGPRRLEGKNSFHDGIDYGVPVGTAVYVPAEGKVARVINDSRCGKGLRIRHGDGTQTIYCHLSKQLVTEGASVGAGCKIAESGNTGHSTGPHLHYGIRNSSGDKINPAAYTKRAK